MALQFATHTLSVAQRGTGLTKFRPSPLWRHGASTFGSVSRATTPASVELYPGTLTGLLQSFPLPSLVAGRGLIVDQCVRPGAFGVADLLDRARRTRPPEPCAGRASVRVVCASPCRCRRWEHYGIRSVGTLAAGRGGMTQSKCGAPTQGGGRCRNKAITGSSRCSKHQGPWSAYGVAQRRKKEAEAKMKQLRKKR